jgi:hypothetical protein
MKIEILSSDFSLSQRSPEGRSIVENEELCTKGGNQAKLPSSAEEGSLLAKIDFLCSKDLTTGRS